MNLFQHAEYADRAENQAAKVGHVKQKMTPEEYMAKNPQVYSAFMFFTRQAIAAGRKKVGAKAVAEQIRWNTMLSGGDDFKLNNDYVSAMARRFMLEFPEHDGIFETRGKK